MPSHYVYRDPDPQSLSQGDILRRTDALVAHLAEYHPYYANNPSYKYFMVLTQGCDLVRRDGRPCSAPYINLAAVRPVEEVLKREAAKLQALWQQPVNVISAKTKDKLVMFLESLLDNNKEGFFYIHTDIGLQIYQDCCAVLQLAVALKAEHYDMCLVAKVAELTEPFQAKLGHLLGHMYSRVGTTEWNSHYPDNKVGKAAADLIGSTFVAFDDRQIEEGINDLRRDKTFTTKTPEEIKNYIDSKKVVPRKQRFQDRALDVLSAEHKPIDQIRGRVGEAIKSDAGLQSGIDELLSEAAIAAESRTALRDAIIARFMGCLRQHLSDEGMPAKKEVIEKILVKLLQDAAIVKILQ